ncbi:MAG: cyclic nucleotide-binding domain-containing protein [Saprospirales bacterium]|nr:cyclic nucleotide-binding domain-containing protein [Saprospirales bacterium]MBK6902062.1 cyclic nucleotide-binding domain-containing protein [Saprospirales bacterium]
MKDKELLKKVNLDWLKRMYFSEPSKYIHLQKGDILLRENEPNDRLYLVLDGSLLGYLGYGSNEVFEAFRSSTDHFVGVYSFFSETHMSYSTVIAEKTCWLAYIDSGHSQHIDEEGRGFAEHFLPIVVDEIYTRQLLTQKMTIRNQEAMRKLFQSEKMAILGQLAAGLAHELNNAVGVIQRHADWMAGWASDLVGRYCEPGMQLFFQRGLQEGQAISSSEIRRRRKEIEDAFDLPSNLARQVAATGITNEDIARLDGDIQGQLEQNLAFFEAGMALHDMLAASGHASRVVRSVKELGVSNHDILARTDLRQTITESLLLLKDLLKSIQVKLELEDQLFVLANPGEMVQIWVNLVKNAGESILESGQKNGLIRIKSWLEEQSVHIQVSDNGPGIPHELLPQIFQPDVTTKVEGLSFGLGLGLSIVQRIVENMRGSVGVESLPGKTVFSITLPLSRD